MQTAALDESRRSKSGFSNLEQRMAAVPSKVAARMVGFVHFLLVVALLMATTGCGNSHKEGEMTNDFDPFDRSQLSETLRELPVSFGDNVRVVESVETDKLGISGLTGQVYGETTPSVRGVEVVGDLKSDAAVNVFFEELQRDFWLSPSLVELIDHAPGTKITVGDKELVRTEDGEWEESK